jgi:tRNA U38,U39,U40 pseudouridine synthase TruA
VADPKVSTAVRAEEREKSAGKFSLNVGGLFLDYFSFRAINTRLPADVSIRSVFLHDDPGFEPRQGVEKKRYVYKIRFHRILRDADNNSILPICHSGANTLKGGTNQEFDDPDRVWCLPWALEASLLQPVCSILCGHHDLACFVHKDDRDKRDHKMTLQRFDAIVHESHTISGDTCRSEEATPSATNVTFIVEAGGFRRSMVRRLVGFVVDVCRGKEGAVKALGPVSSFGSERDTYGSGDMESDNCSLSVDRDIFRPSEETCAEVFSAPACGLCLERVTYKVADNI